MTANKANAARAGDIVRVGVLGFGNVGAALVDLIANDRDLIAHRTGVHLEVSRVAVRDLAKARTHEFPADRLTTDAHSIVVDPEIDVVVELIGGIEPARSLVLEALQSNKPVVTANKELLAKNGHELFAAADAVEQALLFEASVVGAIPLLRALRVSLSGERVLRMMGIVNGTTNYILSRMSEEGIAYKEALAEAQSLGYAEADPTADVGGFDAAAKAAILAGLAFNADINASDVYREGIEQIDVFDIEFVKRLGYEVKLLAIAERTNDDKSGDRPSIAVRVHPAMVPVDHPLASVRGAFNAVFVDGESSGELMFYGRGAGGLPTASAVLGDIIDAASHLRNEARVRLPSRHAVDIAPMGKLASQYYLTVDVSDRPGVLAQVAAVFGECRVSIRSMEQVGLSDEARLIFITHKALEADVQATLSVLHGLDCVRRVGGLLRLVGPER